MNPNYRLKRQIAINLLFAGIGLASDRGTGSELLCFHVSGPAYALLRNFAPGLSLDEVDSQIFEKLSTLDPIKAIIVCASDHDIPLNELISNFDEMITTPTPFLAVIKRQEQAREVFEFVLVEAMKGDAFLVYEFRSQRGWREYKQGTFKRIYAGSILRLGLPENSQNSWIQRAQIFLLGFAAMFIFITLVKRRNRWPALTLTLAVCLVLPGCNQADHGQRSDGNLSVLNPEISLGAKSQKEAISVVFRVKTGESELSLTEIITDCGCLIGPTGFHDKNYPPQSEFELDFTLRTGDQVGDQSHWARITGLANGKSETVECGVNYSVVAKPEVNPERIVLRRIEGGHSYSGKALVSISQLRDAPRAELRLDHPSYFPIKIKLEKFEEAYSAGAAATRHDRFHILLGVNESDVETPAHTRELNLYLVNCDEPTSVRVEFETIQPVDSDTPNIFLGFVPKNTENSATIRLHNRTDSGLDVELEADRDFFSEAGNQLKLEPGLNKIPIRWSSGSAVGRTELTLSVIPQTQPTCVTKLNLSWIVDAGEKR